MVFGWGEDVDTYSFERGDFVPLPIWYPPGFLERYQSMPSMSRSDQYSVS